VKKNLPSGTSRYFIAIVPPPPVFEEVQGLKNYFKEQYQSGAALNSPSHITLHRPFLWSNKGEVFLISSLTDFSITQQPIILELSNFSSFPPRVIFTVVSENEKLKKLQSELDQFCKTTLHLFNAGYNDLSYRPHLTLAFRDLRKPMFARAWEEFKDRKFEASFPVDKINLLRHNGDRWEPYRDFHF
jgi:2'-5' RNA ligase